MARYEMRKMPDFRPDRNKSHKGPWGVWDCDKRRWVLNACYTSKNTASRILVALDSYEKSK